MTTADPGFVAVAYPGHDVHPEPVATVQEEARIAFRTLDEKLREQGLDLSKVVKMRLWYTELQDFPDMNSIREPLYRATFANESWPASSGFVTGGRDGAAPRFECEAIAHREQSGRSTDAAIRQWGDVRPPYAHSNEAGGLVFLSGQGGYAADGTLASPDAREQTEASLGSLGRVLAAEGMTFADVVSVSVFTCGGAFDIVDEIDAMVDDAILAAGGRRDGYVHHSVGCLELAFPGMLVEVEVVASRKASERRLAEVGDARVVVADTAVMASVTASSDTVEGAGAATASAVADLEAALSDSVPAADVTGLVTVWFAPASERAAVTEAAAALVLAGRAVSVQPMPLVPGAAARIAIELVGSVEA